MIAVAVFVVTFVSVAISQDAFPEKCSDQFCYTIYTDLMSLRPEALEICILPGYGDLAAITSGPENDFVNEFLSENMITEGVWISGLYSKISRAWKVDGKEMAYNRFENPDTLNKYFNGDYGIFINGDSYWEPAESSDKHYALCAREIDDSGK